MTLRPPEEITTLEDGLYPGVPDEVYHSLSAVSNSFLKVFARSPAHAVADRAPRKTTPALKLGRAAHSAALEPEIFRKQYHIFDGDRRRKDGREKYNQLAEEHGEDNILTQSDYNTCEGIVDSLGRHRVANRLLSAPGGLNELSVIWRHNGIICKSRVDRYLPSGVLIDIKTTANAHPDAFIRDALDRNYDRQAAFYLQALRYHGVEANTFVFLAVEKIPPYAACAFSPRRDTLKHAWEEHMDLLARYRECLDTDTWPAYADGIHEI